MAGHTEGRGDSRRKPLEEIVEAGWAQALAPVSQR